MIWKRAKSVVHRNPGGLTGLCFLQWHTRSALRKFVHFVMSSNYCYNLKGHDRQYSGQMSQNIQNLKTIEMQSVRQTEVCGKV